MKCTALVLISLVFLSVSAVAQSNELAVTVGGYFPINSSSGANEAFAVGGNFAHRIASVPLVSLYVEVPVIGTFKSVSDIPTSLGKPRYSAFFVTPGLKLKLAPSFPISPYVAAGGGFAHFSKSNVTTDDSTTSGTFDVGGGLDWKVAPFFSARAEVRDFYTGNPNVLPGFTEREHQLVISVGLVFRF